MNDGQATISFGGNTIELGTVTTIQDTFSMTVTQFKIPTLTADRAFTMDAGTIEDFTVMFERKLPDAVDDTSDDSSDWSNAKWVRMLTGAIDRWQMRTNGCRFRFRPLSYETLTEIDENCYIYNATVTYNAGFPEKVTGSMKLKVGTMYRLDEAEPTIPREDMFVTISNTTGESSYYLMIGDTELNCIKSYRIKGGIEQPFEYLTMTIPRKRLANYLVPLEGKRGLIAGCNVITVSAYGFAQFIVTKCKLSGGDYQITGYSLAEAFKGAVTTVAYDNTLTPYAIIADILRRGVTIGDSLSISYSGENLVENVSKDVESWSGEVLFPEGSNCWYVMQVCAMRIGARLFFAENKAYLVDITDKKVGHEIIPNIGKINLSSYEDNVAVNMIGSSKRGDEGSSTVVNNVTVVYGDNKKTMSPSLLQEVRASKKIYGVKTGGTITVKEVKDSVDALLIAWGYMHTLLDSQTSFGFNVKELTDKGWVETFSPLTRADSITDEDGDETITNESYSMDIYNEGKKPFYDDFTRYHLLMMSTFERKFPEGISEYWWGIQQKVDLSQTISQIQNALNN